MRFPYEWTLKSGYGRNPNGLACLSTFSCGGGSTMGWKLAGYQVRGAVEIDPKLAEVYVKNHRPEIIWCEDVRTFVEREDLPEWAYELDVLDGSPPCSVFSTAGRREAGWGVAKQFREGQAMQRLDDLFPVFASTAKRLRPKVVVAENVMGMLKGAAKGFVKEAVEAIDAAGYRTQVFRLNAAHMGVPQARERLFFIGLRNDIERPKLRLEFHDDPIQFKRIKRQGGLPPKPLSAASLHIWKNRRPGDLGFDDVNKRLKGKATNFNSHFVLDERVVPTITATVASKLVLATEPRLMNKAEMMLAGSWPLDYDFGDLDPRYVIGMSVPPVMMARIAVEIQNQWLSVGSSLSDSEGEEQPLIDVT
ncbi:DNA cytosine methyltransferase [bacterium]|nr:MAG: DNA cytosine methyltransferase [bacterium]